MANNYSQATVEPFLPTAHVTDMELGLLNLAGISYEKASEDRYYFFAEEYFSGEVCTEDLEECVDDPAVPADPRNTPYYEGENLRADIETEEIFQNILCRLPKEYTYIVIQGADSCTKMRPGEFGGFAVFITRDGVKYHSTWRWVDEQLHALRAEGEV